MQILKGKDGDYMTGVSSAAICGQDFKINI